VTQLDAWLHALFAATTLDESTIVFLKGTALAQWVVTTPWVWPTAEALHFLGLALLVGTIAPLDVRLLGFMRSVPIAAFRELVPWAVAGFVINLMTGMLFFVAAPDQYIRNLSWWFKVLFLAIAGVNMLLFETTQRSRIQAMEPGDVTPAAFRAIGGVSLVSWLMVVYWGRMLPFLGNAF
jgi:anti-sigma factor RsiW